MNREGTLHIVQVSHAQPRPRYSVGFADNASSGGAMKTTQIDGEENLRRFFTGIGVNERIIQSVLENLRTQGQANVLRVVLPEEMLVALGLKQTVGNEKAKVEAAIAMLVQQGHKVQVVVRDGTMWVEVDHHVLIAWKEMQGLADGLYSFDGLLQIYKTVVPVRFTVFNEPEGPVLSYAVAAPYSSPTFSSKAGARYPDLPSLIRALNDAGLPGAEIATRQTTKVYTLTGAQLLHLNLRPWLG